MPGHVPVSETANEVSKVVFYEGGATTYSVTREKPDTLVVKAVMSSDGACGDASCKDQGKVLQTIAIPADATVTDKIEIVDAKGTTTPFACQ